MDPFERVKNLATLVREATGAKRLLGLEAIIDRVGALVPDEPARTRIALDISRRLITTTNLHDSQSTEIAEEIEHLDDPKNAAFLTRLCVVKEVLLHMKDLPDDRLQAGIRAAQMASELQGLFDRNLDKRVDKLVSELFDYGLFIITGVE